MLWERKKNNPVQGTWLELLALRKDQAQLLFVLRNVLKLLDKPLAAARPAPSQSQPSARGMLSQSFSPSTPLPATKIDFSNADLRRASGLVLASVLKKLLRWES